MVMDEIDDPDRGSLDAGGRALDKVRAALLRLPAIERALVHLHRYERLALPDVAQVLSLSDSAVRRLGLRVYRRLGRLRHRSSGEDGIPSCPSGPWYRKTATALASMASDDPALATALAHATTCPECARALASGEATLALIDAAFPLETAEPAVLERIKEALLGDIRITSATIRSPR